MNHIFINIKKHIIKYRYEYLAFIIPFIMGLILSLLRYPGMDEIGYLYDSMFISEYFKMGKWIGESGIGLHGFIFKIPVALIFMFSGSNVFIATLSNVIFGSLASFYLYRLMNYFIKKQALSLLATFSVVFSYQWFLNFPSYLRDLPSAFALLFFFWVFINRKNFLILGILLLLVFDSKEYVGFFLIPPLFIWLFITEFFNRDNKIFKRLWGFTYKNVLLFTPTIIFVYMMFWTNYIPINDFVGEILKFKESRKEGKILAQQKIKELQQESEKENLAFEDVESGTNPNSPSEPQKRRLGEDNLTSSVSKSTSQSANSPNKIIRKKITPIVEKVAIYEKKLAKQIKNQTELKSKAIDDSLKFASLNKKQNSNRPKITNNISQISTKPKEIFALKPVEKINNVLAVNYKKDIRKKREETETKTKVTTQERTNIQETRNQNGNNKESQISSLIPDKAKTLLDNSIDESIIRNNPVSNKLLIDFLADNKISSSDNTVLGLANELEVLKEKDSLKYKELVSKLVDSYRGNNQLSNISKNDITNKNSITLNDTLLASNEIKKEKSSVPNSKLPKVVKKINNPILASSIEKPKSVNIVFDSLKILIEQIELSLKTKKIDTNIISSQSIASKLENTKTSNKKGLKSEFVSPKMRKSNVHIDNSIPTPNDNEKYNQVLKSEEQKLSQFIIAKLNNQKRTPNNEKKIFTIGLLTSNQIENQPILLLSKKDSTSQNVPSVNDLLTFRQSTDELETQKDKSIIENNANKESRKENKDAGFKFLTPKFMTTEDIPSYVVPEKLDDHFEEFEEIRMEAKSKTAIFQFNKRNITEVRLSIWQRIENLTIDIANFMITFLQKIMHPRVFSYLSIPIFIVVIALFTMFRDLRNNYRNNSNLLFFSLFFIIYMLIYIFKVSHGRYLLHLAPVIILFFIMTYKEGIFNRNIYKYSLILGFSLTFISSIFEYRDLPVKLFINSVFLALFLSFIIKIPKIDKIFSFSRKVKLVLSILIIFSTGTALYSSFTQGQIFYYLNYGYFSEYDEVSKYINKNENYWINETLGIEKIFNRDMNHFLPQWRWEKYIYKDFIPKPNPSIGFANNYWYDYIESPKIAQNLNIVNFYVIEPKSDELHFSKKNAQNLIQRINSQTWIRYQETIQFNNKKLHIFKVNWE